MINFRNSLNMGTQLIKGYTVDKDSKGMVGANGQWKLHHGTKQGGNESASILIIEKKSLSKGDKEELLKSLRKEATSLVKFRHPYIISISEALLEDEHSMGFVVEKLEGNLKMLIQGGKFLEMCSTELELKIHLLELLQAITFLHNNVKIVHLGINLNNIYVTAEGKWKLGGFIHSQQMSGDGLQDCENKPSEVTYAAPEVVIQSKCAYTSDTFSLMAVALTLLEMINHPSRSLNPLINASNKAEYERHKEVFLRIDKHPYVASSQNASELGRLAIDTLCWDWGKRRSINQISNCEWLNDNFTVTIKHLSSIINLEQKMQLEFLRGLSATVLKFEPSLIKKRIIPTLLELLKFDYLTPGIVLTLIELMKKDIISVPDFQKTIWTTIKTLTQGKQISAHALYMFVDNVEVFSRFVSLPDLNATIIPLYVKCFDCPNKLKELGLRKVQFLSKKLDYQIVKSKLLPKILSLVSDKTTEIRKLALIVLYKTASTFDSQVVTDQILPALDKLRKVGTDPFSNAISLKLYTLFSKNLSIEVIGTKIIPGLVPYLMEPSISNAEFELYKNTINGLMAKIQSDRAKNPSTADGPIFTEADFDLPKDEKEKDYVRQQSQPNFDFLSMFKQEQPQRQPINEQFQQPQIQQQQIPFQASSSNGQEININFGDNASGFNFNGFSTLQTTPNNTYNLPIQKSTPGLDLAGFSIRSQLQPQAFQLPAQQPKPLSTASDDFFSMLEEKPDSQTKKFNIKGPSIDKVQVPFQPQHQPVQQFQQPNSLYSMNSNSNDPFSSLSKDLNDFGDFTNPSNALAPTYDPNLQVNFMAPNTNFLNPTSNNPIHSTQLKPLTIKKPGSQAVPTKNVNQISGDSFFDLL